MPDRFGKVDADSLRQRDALTDKHLRDGRSSRRSEASHNCQHPQRLIRAKTSYDPRVPFRRNPCLRVTERDTYGPSPTILQGFPAVRILCRHTT